MLLSSTIPLPCEGQTSTRRSSDLYFTLKSSCQQPSRPPTNLFTACCALQSLIKTDVLLPKNEKPNKTTNDVIKTTPKQMFLGSPIDFAPVLNSKPRPKSSRTRRFPSQGTPRLVRPMTSLRLSLPQPNDHTKHASSRKRRLSSIFEDDTFSVSGSEGAGTDEDDNKENTTLSLGVPKSDSPTIPFSEAPVCNKPTTPSPKTPPYMTPQSKENSRSTKRRRLPPSIPWGLERDHFERILSEGEQKRGHALDQEQDKQGEQVTQLDAEVTSQRKSNSSDEHGQLGRNTKTPKTAYTTHLSTPAPSREIGAAVDTPFVRMVSSKLRLEM